MKAFFGLLAFLVISSCSFGQAKVKLNDAKKHVGETVTKEGRVSSIQYLRDAEGSPTFWDIGGVYPNQKLRVVIWGVDRKKFTMAPEEVFQNKNLRVTGKISKYEGKLQMVVSNPAEIIRIEK